MAAKPFVIGLTGSIGMGKSETARLFAEEGVKVHDADAAIHALYAPGGEATRLLAENFPGIVRDGEVDRLKLSARVTADAAALKKLERLVHPLVRAGRDQFLEQNSHAEIVLLDIPLLYETGADKHVDAVVVVSAPAEIQRARVLARPGMTAEKFEALHARQLGDAQKRAQADYLVETDKGLDQARRQVKMILGEIRKKISNA